MDNPGDYQVVGKCWSVPNSNGDSASIVCYPSPGEEKP